MLQFVSLRISNDENRYSQKCHIPLLFMANSTIERDDVVLINCGNLFYICIAIPIPITALNTYISIDDTVSLNAFSHQTTFTPKIREKISLSSCDFKVVRPTTFDRIQVRVVFNDEKEVLVNNDAYCHIIFKLLQHYVITKNATVKCEDRCLAVSYHIDSIIITETFKDPEVFGRLTRNAKVDIVEVISKEQLNQLSEFKGLDVGGIEEPKRTLSFYLFNKATKKILISGPSGSGKSLFVKKFLSDIKCCLVIIDGLKDNNLTMNKCDVYSKQLLQSLKKFPDVPCILLVDHINEIASSNVKRLNQSSVSALVYLFKGLENSRVSVIVISTEKKNIHPEISRLFEDEVIL